MNLAVGMLIENNFTFVSTELPFLVLLFILLYIWIVFPVLHKWKKQNTEMKDPFGLQLALLIIFLKYRTRGLIEEF